MTQTGGVSNSFFHLRLWHIFRLVLLFGIDSRQMLSLFQKETQSIASTAINFLSAFALVQNGVREILPFVRYIAQFMDFEFDAIKQQDQGRGVVCAATW